MNYHRIGLFVGLGRLLWVYFLTFARRQQSLIHHLLLPFMLMYNYLLNYIQSLTMKYDNPPSRYGQEGECLMNIYGRRKILFRKHGLNEYQRDKDVERVSFRVCHMIVFRGGDGRVRASEVRIWCCEGTVTNLQDSMIPQNFAMVLVSCTSMLYVSPLDVDFPSTFLCHRVVHTRCVMCIERVCKVCLSDVDFCVP